jgi:transcriptional regulator with XRE-family HTH domain
MADTYRIILREKREAARYSQLGLAKASGVTRQRIREIEDGAVSVQTDTLFKLARALNCTIGDLIAQ